MYVDLRRIRSGSLERFSQVTELATKTLSVVDSSGFSMALPDHIATMAGPQILKKKCWPHVEVSWNRGPLQIIHFNGIFHYKPSTLGTSFKRLKIQRSNWDPQLRLWRWSSMAEATPKEDVRAVP